MTTVEFKIGDEVIFSDAFGVNEITEIKGKSAVVFEKNTKITRTKRLSSLKPYVEQKAYWNEQELAVANYKHGDIVLQSISLNGGSSLVWDDIQKKCVEPKDLSN